MKELRFGEFVWYRGNGWRYIGMDEDGTIHLCRPMEGICFDVVEFDQIYPADDSDDYDQFLQDNGESHSEYCKRKEIEVPK